MRQLTHKRSRFTNKTVALVAVLALGGGGAALVAANASANGSRQDSPRASAGERPPSGTVTCPDVGDRLRDVPRRARGEVDRNLAQLDSQIAKAFQRMASGQGKGATVLSGLNRERRSTIGNISDAIGRASGRPQGLEALTTCRIKNNPAGGNGQGNGDDQGDGQGNGQDQGNGDGQGNNQGDGNGQGNGGQGGGNTGPTRDDFVDITTVQPNVNPPQNGANASTGTFTSDCGRNADGHRNPDNVIVAPGVSNGAHHMHDYVGNKSTDGFSTDDSLAAAGTTCSNGDQSTHYWPVLRLQDGKKEKDADAPGGGQDANVGTILTPKSAGITFRGSPAGKVTAMPRFLRIITGDAKAFTNGTANANASWSCTGFENRQLKDKYPLCPQGSDVVRTLNFQSCWDGRNTDSANHRTHVAFAQADGSCAGGFQAIPQLQQRITYSIPKGSLFAVDSFPEQLHKPVTDHGDFIDVMSDALMKKAVGCVNGGQRCR